MSSTFAGKPWTKRYDRISQRSRRHPNWRQDYVDSDGMCQFPVWDDLGETICGAIDTLELHHFSPEEQVSLFADSRACLVLAGRRVLLCREHHATVHGDVIPVINSRLSLLAEDIDWEIISAGSAEIWARKYGVKLGW